MHHLSRIFLTATLAVLIGLGMLSALTGCTDEATLTGPALEAPTPDEAALTLDDEAVMRLRRTAVVDLSGVVTKLNRKRGEALVEFEGTTNEGEPIRGRGTMRFKGELDASTSTFTIKRFQIKFKGVLGEDEAPIRGQGRSDKGAESTHILASPDVYLVGVEMLIFTDGFESGDISR